MVRIKYMRRLFQGLNIWGLHGASDQATTQGNPVRKNLLYQLENTPAKKTHLRLKYTELVDNVIFPHCLYKRTALSLPYSMHPEM